MNLSKTFRTGLLILPILLITATICPAKPASVLLQEGIYAEQTKGDLDAAIKIYEQIIEDASTQRPVAAEAMYRLSNCFVKLQNEQKARLTLGRLVEQYSEQTAIIEKAEELLEQLSEYDPAALMPPQTFYYVEFGSPGRQIETILNMLKGTPFENPLTVLAGSGQKRPQQRTPADIMAALLNPSMMAEFKKIRGMAFGFYGLGNQPPLVAVLYPGKSDALRGIILAGLGMAGTISEDIEGMHILKLGNGAATAYDDEVIIAVQEPNGLDERLLWCIRQYKGISSEPSLASQNQLFKRLNRKSRQDSAVTMWLNSSDALEVISRQMTGVMQSNQFRALEGILDFKNIEGLATQISLNQDKIGVEVNVDFKTGHNCLAYQLIRTPNLTKAGFAAVPADAFAVASFALSEPESRQAQKAQEAIKKLTGLSIGQEIFANIEQVTVFATEPVTSMRETALYKQLSPAAACVGLTVSSHNPEQTRLVLGELLRTVDLLASSSAGEQQEKGLKQAEGRYRIGTIDSEPLYCYMAQSGKTTVIALSKETLYATIAALNDNRTALASGPLAGSLKTLPGDTGKLAIVNLGGAIRMANAHIHRQVDTRGEPDNYPLYGQLEQLAAACEKTELQFRTIEGDNNFNVHASLSDIPPLAGVIGFLMQLPDRIPENLTARAMRPQPADGATTSTEIKRLKWEPGVNAVSHKIYFGKSKDELALLSEVKAARFKELGALEEDKTYYWRVDEVSADGTVTAGDVWRFTTGGKLVAYWKFDEGAGNTASDSSGNGNKGALQNMTDSAWVEGTDGVALEFDGKDDCIRVPDSDSIEFADGPFTLCLWMKRPAGKDNCRIIVNGTSGQEFEGATGRRYEVYNHGSEIRFSIDDGKTKSKLTVSDKNYVTGEWVHVAVIRDVSAGKLKIYRNGKLRKTAPDTCGNISSPGEDLYIGAAQNWMLDKSKGPIIDFYEGTLDDIRMYNYALSDDEVKQIYDSTKKGEPKEQQDTERIPSKQQQQIEAQIRMLESQLEMVDKQLGENVDEQTRRLVREKMEKAMEKLQEQLEKQREGSMEKLDDVLENLDEQMEESDTMERQDTGYSLSLKKQLESALPAGGKVFAKTDVGYINVTGRDADGLECEATILIEAPTTQQAEELAKQVKVRLKTTSDGLTIETEKPKVRGESKMKVNLDIRVPRQTVLELKTDVGKINVTNITSDIRAKSDVGDIVCEDIAGEIDLKTDVGKVSAAYLKDAPGAVDAAIKTDVGAIDFVGPSGLSAKLTATTGTGAIKTDYDLRITGMVGKKAEGVIGDGKGRVFLKTDVGAINIR
jgi:tetratricopeptide (TPR) repeat protein